VSPEPFVVDLVTGVDAPAPVIDESLGRNAHRLDLERMPARHRNICASEFLRELASMRHDVQMGRGSSRGGRVAKRVIHRRAGRFVNGMLAEQSQPRLVRRQNAG